MLPLRAQSGLAAVQRGNRGLRSGSSHSRNTKSSTLSEAWPDARTFGCLKRSLDYGARYDRTEPGADIYKKPAEQRLEKSGIQICERLFYCGPHFGAPSVGRFEVL